MVVTVTEKVTDTELLAVAVLIRLWPSTPAKPRHTEKIRSQNKFIALAVTLSKT